MYTPAAEGKGSVNFLLFYFCVKVFHGDKSNIF